jgi:hypothetical protein
MRSGRDIHCYDGGRVATGPWPEVRREGGGSDGPITRYGPARGLVSFARATEGTTATHMELANEASKLGEISPEW